jgi:Na+/melibiose symporter-like transporter
MLVLLAAGPSWPRWSVLLLMSFGAVGYAVVDLMPWSMLGEVVDEDDLASGERREGIYNGLFTFLRKLGGSIAVVLAMLLLGALGFSKGEEQNTETVTAIRLLTTLAPAAFLALAIWIARGYPLTREKHARIVERIAARDAAR